MRKYQIHFTKSKLHSTKLIKKLLEDELPDCKTQIESRDFFFRKIK